MKRIIVLLTVFISLVSNSQEYIEINKLDISGVTTDTMFNVSLKPIGNATLLEVDFTNCNCDSLQLNIGYSLTDTKPAFLSALGQFTFPVTLNKTTYTNTYLGVESNQLIFDKPNYGANYFWVQILNPPVTCTRGNIKIRYKKP